MVSIAKENSGDELQRILKEKLNEKNFLGEIEQIEDPNVIWEYFAMRSVVSAFSSSSGTGYRLGDIEWKTLG